MKTSCWPALRPCVEEEAILDENRKAFRPVGDPFREEDFSVDDNAFEDSPRSSMSRRRAVSEDSFTLTNYSPSKHCSSSEDWSSSIETRDPRPRISMDNPFCLVDDDNDNSLVGFRNLASDILAAAPKSQRNLSKELKLSVDTTFVSEGSTFSTPSEGSPADRSLIRRSTLSKSFMSEGMEDVAFPMMVVEISTFQQWQSLPPYPEVSANREHVNQMARRQKEAVHFVSHEWYGAKHPDPEGIKLRRLQSHFNRCSEEDDLLEVFAPNDWHAFAAGSVRRNPIASRAVSGMRSRIRASSHNSSMSPVGNSPAFSRMSGEETAEQFKNVYSRDVVKGVVWMDWLSIPQLTDSMDELQRDQALLDQALAIESIPFYLQQVTYFYILAPAARHENGNLCNFKSWEGRAWCRVEEYCNFLTPKEFTSPVVLSDAPQVKLRDFFEYFMSRGTQVKHNVFCGDFTCCTRNHLVPLGDGRTAQIRCDKCTIAPVLAAMYDKKVESLQVAGNDFLARTFQCMEASFFTGSDFDRSNKVNDPQESVEDFLIRFNLPESPFEPDWTGAPAIEWAAFAGHTAMVKKLIDLKCPADVTDLGGHTPLLGAVLSNDAYNMVELLLREGNLSSADINKVCDVGLSPLDRACRGGEVGVVTLLLDAGASLAARPDGASPLFEAVAGGHIEVMQILLEHGANATVVTDAGNTALHVAAQSLDLLGNAQLCVDIVELLLDHGADRRARNDAGQTAYEAAVRDGNSAIAMALEKANSKSSARPLVSL